MSRVIWLAGSTDADAATFAEATADAVLSSGLPFEGSSVDIVDASTGAHGTTGWDAAAALLPVWETVAAEVGADPLVGEAWSGLPGIDHVSAWQRIAASGAHHDVVVVAGGTHSRTRELVGAPRALLRLLDAVLTPRTAMWRSRSGAGVFDEVSRVRAEVCRWVRIVEDEASTARLLCRPELAEVDRMLDAAAHLRLQGLAVEGMAVTHYPRGKEPWPDWVRASARSALARVEENNEGAVVWRSTSRLRPVPKGRKPASIWFAGGERGAVIDADLQPEEGEGGFDLAVRLPARVSRNADLGTTSSHLVIAFDGAYRWLELPGVLQRCTLESARRVNGGWRLRWVPDPGLWPAAGAA